MAETPMVMDYVAGGLFVALVTIVAKYWNWPGSRRSDMPPGMNISVAVVHDLMG
jgi:hypothetical protein